MKKFVTKKCLTQSVIYPVKQTSIQQLKKNRLINKVMDKKVIFAALLLGAVGYGSYKYCDCTDSFGSLSV
jgi:hypothetical protein